MNDVIRALVGFAVFVFSVIIHEMAHGLTAERFGDLTARESGRITLNPIPHIDPFGSILLPLLAFMSHIPFIGWAKPVPVNPANLRNPFKHQAYVAAAGPISNFALVVIGTVSWVIVGVFYKHASFLHELGGSSIQFFSILFGNLIIINSVLGVFNLIPIPPLDGHWILFRLLPPGLQGSLVSIRPYGFFILIILLWAGVLGKIISLPIHLIYDRAVGLVLYLVAAL